MRHSAQRIFGTAFFLLLAASTLDVASAQGAPAGQDQTGKLQADVEYLIKTVDSLTKQLKKSPDVPPPLPESDSVQTQATLLDLQVHLKNLEVQLDAIRNSQKELPAQLKNLELQVDSLRTVQKGFSPQIEKSSTIQMRVEFLALTALLAAGTLLLGLLQLRALRALVRERLEKPKSVDGRADLPLNSAALLTNTHPEVASGKEAVPSPSHQKVAKLLTRLRQESPRLAEGFGDSSLQQRFLGEFGAPMGALLDRLRAYSEQGELQVREKWLGHDLVTTLDALARFYSEAVEEGRQGRAAAKGLARKLRAWLYDRFSPACQAEGWFAIDLVDPYRTDFDPDVHRAVADRDVESATGKVIAIKTIGRRDPKSGAVIHKAEVIVGR